MKSKVGLVALVLLIVLIIVVAYLVQVLTDRGIGSLEVDDSLNSITLNYDDVVWVDIPCEPEKWTHLIKFQLRESNGTVVEEQEVYSGCELTCQVGEGECLVKVRPEEWSVTPAGLQTWFSARWAHDSGVEFIVHHPSVEEFEDSTGFIWFEELPEEYKIYTPILYSGT